MFDCWSLCVARCVLFVVCRVSCAYMFCLLAIAALSYGLLIAVCCLVVRFDVFGG